MNPIQTGRMILALLPYTLFVGGVLAAAKVGGVAAVEALSVAGIGLIWVAVRHRHRHG